MISGKNKDILFEKGDVCFCFSYLSWDSQFFQRPSYVLDTSRSCLGVLDKKNSQSLSRILQGSFVTAKIDTAVSHQLIKSLFALDFYYVETEVTLEFIKSGCLAQGDAVYGQNIVVEKKEVNAGLPYIKLGSSFSHTRFHTDSSIKDKLADDLWISYLKNYLPDENHHMIIAKYKDQIAGTILANEVGNKIILFFVAIREEFRGKGIGSALMNYVVRYFDNQQIITGTQIKNIPALNYYIKNGFSKIISTKTVLHHWG